MKKILLLLMGFLAVTAVQVRAQNAPPQKDIDAAIEKGANYLISKYPKDIPTNIWQFELIVYTLIHAEANPQKDPLKNGIDKLIAGKYLDLHDAKKGVEHRMNYRVAIRALALHSLLVKMKQNTYYYPLKPSAALIQRKIAESAQYLVDTQLDNGQWTYAGVLKNTPKITSLTTGAPPTESEFNKTASKAAWENASNTTGTLYKLIPKYGADPKDKGTDLGKPVELGKQKGDNSNTQYGVLGLIAAQMSGVEVPRTTWELVLKWFETAQWSDGGFGYQEGDGGSAEGTAVARRIPGGISAQKGSYGTMTTAGAVALAAANKYLGKDFKNDKKFQAALNWLSTNFSVTTEPNPKHGPNSFLLYFLYGIERVGAFSEMKKLGTHDWYAEGATELLKTQKADGSWGTGTYEEGVVGTSFAILFLKRATSDMISSGVGAINAK